jgi:hypothetical protein
MIRTKHSRSKVVSFTTEHEKRRRDEALAARRRAFNAGWSVLLAYLPTWLDQQDPEASLESLPAGSSWGDDMYRMVGRLFLEVPELVEAVEQAIGSSSGGGGGLPQTDERSVAA